MRCIQNRAATGACPLLPSDLRTTQLKYFFSVPVGGWGCQRILDRKAQEQPVLPIVMTPTIFTVEPQHLGNLSADTAIVFFAELLWSEARRTGIPIAAIKISTRVNVPDGGVDAQIDTNQFAAQTDLVMPGLTAYQVKAGTTFEPWQEGVIKRELFGNNPVHKDSLGGAVKKCLDDGGTYVLVCTGKSLTPQESQAAEAHCKSFFAQCGYQNTSVVVLSQTQVIGLLGVHPSLSLRLNGKAGANFQSHQSWSNQSEMRKNFKEGKSQKDFIEAIQTAMREIDAVHIRVRGEAGVGKTRLGLEALKVEDLAPLVIYCDSPKMYMGSALESELLRDDNQFAVILVVDECDIDSMGRMWNKLQHRKALTKLMTLFNEFDNVSGETRLVDAPPLDEEQLSAILADYGVPEDRRRRFAEICEGSPRWAHIIGLNLQQNPEDILRDPDTVSIVDRYIAGRDAPNSEAAGDRRTVLLYLSLFKRFGYSAPVANEAKAIHALVQASKPSITWPRFQEIIQDLRDRKILQGETTLYITPKAFQIKLWVQWWHAHGAQFDLDEFTKQLDGKLIDWFFEMFKFGASAPAALHISEELLKEIGNRGGISFFESGRGSKFFLALTEAAPEAALTALKKTVGTLDRDQLLDFTTGRRNVIWSLERIVVWRDLFVDGARLLLKLAEAENEKWSNNATGMFADLFTPGEGPVASTEASPELRFPVLVEALDSTSADVRRIGLLSCEKALETGQFSRAVGAEYQGLKRQPELWTPKTYGERFDAYRRVWNLLEGRLDAFHEKDRQHAVKILLSRARGVGYSANLAPMVVSTLKALAKRPDVDKREIIEVVQDVLRYDAKEFPPESLALWTDLRDTILTGDYHSQMQRWVGMELLEDRITLDGKSVDNAAKPVASLVEQTLADRDLLDAELPWLVTKEAKSGFRFGYELGQKDNSVVFLARIFAAVRAAGKDANAFFLGGYLRALRERDSDSVEQILDAIGALAEIRHLMPELTWRTGVTDRGAERLLSLAREGSISGTSLRMFAFGGTIRNLSEKVLQSWIEFLLATNTREAVAVAIELFDFYYLMGDAPPQMPEELTFKLLTAEPLLKGEGNAPQMEDYEWNQIATKFIDLYPEKAAALGKALIEHFGNDGNIIDGHSPYSLETLNEILKRHPMELWDAIWPLLGPPLDSRAFQLRQWLHKGASQLIPADKIWQWVEGDVEKRAWYSALLVPQIFPGEGGFNAREILVRYGHRDDVRSNLRANFGTEMWWGAESQHFQQKKDWLLGLKKSETNPNVRQWIDEYLESVNWHINRAKVEEERED